MKPPPQSSRLLRPLLTQLPPSTPTRCTHHPTRPFSTSRSLLTRNRIYEPIRSLPALQTALSLSSTSSRPLLALFSISTVGGPTRRISELLLQLVEQDGVGERDGGVGFAEVEMDAPDCEAEDVGGLYAITSIPTLMAFSRGEPQQLTKLTDTAELQDREFLTLWIENEARRGGAGGAGGGFFGGIFGLGSN
ncbi:hypothetical protein MMC11_008994 [Xylographa trunciseda]|nr:hypothetical protein [Xylographa trunciseda]